jgi:hypothetical protein
MSWFSKGKESVQQAAHVAEEQRKNRAPYRVRVLPQKTIPVIYLDDEGFSFQEHTVQNGKRWEQFTCSGPATCPLCQSGDKPYFVTLFTVIEMTEWVDARGQTHKNEKKIHALKSEAALVLMNKKERWGGLKGKGVYLTRKGDKDPSSGSDFELMLHPQKNTPMVYKIDSSKPEHQAFEYASIFEPKSPEFIKTALGMNVSMSGFSAPAASMSPQPAASAFEVLDPMDMGGDESSESANVPF